MKISNKSALKGYHSLFRDLRPEGRSYFGYGIGKKHAGWKNQGTTQLADSFSGKLIWRLNKNNNSVLQGGVMDDKKEIGFSPDLTRIIKMSIELESNSCI